jgi:hypothetical protein
MKKHVAVLADTPQEFHAFSNSFMNTKNYYSKSYNKLELNNQTFHMVLTPDDVRGQNLDGFIGVGRWYIHWTPERIQNYIIPNMAKRTP